MDEDSHKDGHEEQKTLWEVEASPMLSWIALQKMCSITGGWLDNRKVRTDPTFSVALMFHMYLLWKVKNKKYLACYKLLVNTSVLLAYHDYVRIGRGPEIGSPVLQWKRSPPWGCPWCCCPWAVSKVRCWVTVLGGGDLRVKMEVLELREPESIWPFLASLFIHGRPDGRAGPASWGSLDRGDVAHPL